MSAWTAVGSPAAAARCRALAPDVVSAFASLPAASSSRTTAACPPRAAIWSGVYAPMRVVARTFAFALSSTAAIAESPRSAAQCRAVIPSPWAALTLAPLAMSERTAATSPFIAASATGDGCVLKPVRARERVNPPTKLSLTRPPKRLNREGSEGNRCWLSGTTVCRWRNNNHSSFAVLRAPPRPPRSTAVQFALLRALRVQKSGCSSSHPSRLIN